MLQKSSKQITQKSEQKSVPALFAPTVLEVLRLELEPLPDVGICFQQSTPRRLPLSPVNSRHQRLIFYLCKSSIVPLTHLTFSLVRTR